MHAAYDWRLIHTGPQEPALHMALDEVLTLEVAAGRRPPTLRVWEWATPAVVIGNFQSVRNEVDVDVAARHGMTVVRRSSGGGAMYVEPEHTITHSLHAPVSLVEGMSIVESYAYLDDWVLAALAGLGVEAFHQPVNDIASPVGKIAGAAQRRFASGGVLHHVTMAYDIDAATMAEVLRFGLERLPGPGTRSVQKHVDPLRRQTTRSRAEVVEHMVATFRRRYGLADDEIRTDELRAAEKLAATKYATSRWTARLP